MWQTVANRCARHGRPLIMRLGNRGYCSRRNIPVKPPGPEPKSWGEHRDLFFRDSEHKFGRIAREVERWMAQRSGACSGAHSYGRPGEAAARSEGAQVTHDNKLYEVRLDVQHYSPEEINLKLVDNKLTVTGKHEQRADEHGYVSREFHREFSVPENVDLDSLASSFTEDGMLLLRADVKVAEKVIKIQREPKTNKTES